MRVTQVLVLRVRGFESPPLLKVPCFVFLFVWGVSSSGRAVDCSRVMSVCHQLVASSILAVEIFVCLCPDSVAG